MSDLASFSLPTDNDSAGGGPEEVLWEVVTTTNGLLTATIIAGRLQADGIPARAWQESVGHAYGLTVGPLGTGYVAVPESYYEQALDLLDEEMDEEE